MAEIIMEDNGAINVNVIHEGDRSITLESSDSTSQEISVEVEGSESELIEISDDAEESTDIVDVQQEARSIISYLRLVDKPSINEVILEYDKSFEELGLTEITNMELDALLED